MATKYMKLGYEKYVIHNEDFYNLRLSDKMIGFNMGIRMNYYRGLHLACVESLKVKIDGKEIPEQLILFNLNGKKFTIKSLKDMYQEYWGIKEIAQLQIFNGGLSQGKHKVEVELYLRNPYMQFAPGVYGAINSSAAKELELMGVKELC